LEGKTEQELGPSPLIPIMMIGSGTGYSTGDATNHGSKHRSLPVADCGSDHGSRGSAPPDNCSSPTIVSALIVVAVAASVDRSAINGRRGVDIATIAIPSIIVSAIASPAVVPLTIRLAADRLSRTAVSVVVVLRRHSRNTRADERRKDANRYKVSNAFHKCLRL
jgi:hypothetical protein